LDYLEFCGSPRCSALEKELRSDLATCSASGGACDPGPNSPGGHDADFLINLQTAISVFWDNSHIYNPVTYLLCGPLLLIWIITTLRARASATSAWLALAAIVTLSMLPLYHRQHDTRLLLLTIPACAMLWLKAASLVGSRRPELRWCRLERRYLFGDSHSSLLERLASASGFPFKLLTVVLGRPIPLILLIMCIFYLWAYIRHHLQPLGINDAFPAARFHLQKPGPRMIPAVLPKPMTACEFTDPPETTMRLDAGDSKFWSVPTPAALRAIGIWSRMGLGAGLSAYHDLWVLTGATAEMKSKRARATA